MWAHKRHYLTVIAVTILMFACQSSEESTAPAVDPFTVAWSDRTLFDQGLIAGEKEVLTALPGATVYHIDLTIDKDLSSIQGTEAVLYTNRETEPLDAIYFRLFPNSAGGRLTISSILAGGREVMPVTESGESALRVSLPQTLQPGDEVEIAMSFDIMIPREMAGNYGLFGFFDDVLVLDTFYPMIPAYDDDGWHIKTPPENGDVTFTDASFYLVRVSAPRRLTVIASGVEIGSERQGKNQILTFAAGPARDFYLAASDEYAVVSQAVGETVINSYAFKNRKDGAETALEFAIAALQHFSERLGPYPYTELDVLSTPMQALGIEYPGAIGISLDLYEPDIETFGLPYPIVLESTTAHEVGHQWFYNIVGNDQVNEPWVDEALVQYITGLYYLDTYGEEAAGQYRESWDGSWARVDRAKIPVGMPSEQYISEAYSPIVYGRGPLFVTALEARMGVPKFRTFLRDYVQSNWWGIGTGESFRQLAETHCQCDLGDLFQEWVYE